MGTATLTYEEMSTLLCQIETFLNSRPLGAFLDDPMDLVILTMEHFLIGSALKATPGPTLFDMPTSWLSCWQHLQ